MTSPSGGQTTRRAIQAEIVTYQGDQDGIRFGKVRIDGRVNCYLWDRYNDAVQLYRVAHWVKDGSGIGVETDHDVGRRMATLQALRGRP